MTYPNDNPLTIGWIRNSTGKKDMMNIMNLDHHVILYFVV